MHYSAILPFSGRVGFYVAPRRNSWECAKYGWIPFSKGQTGTVHEASRRKEGAVRKCSCDGMFAKKRSVKVFVRQIWLSQSDNVDKI